MQNEELNIAKINNILSSLPENLQFTRVKFNKNIDGIFTKSNRKYYIIGYENTPNKIGINVKTLEVVQITKYHIRHINASLENFLECMKSVNRKINLQQFQINDYLPKEEQKIIETELTTAISEIDAKCLEYEESWWKKKITNILHFHFGGFAEHSIDFK